MAVTLHFLDVGQGNMVLMQLDNGQNIVYDCNITQGTRIRFYRIFTLSSDMMDRLTSLSVLIVRLTI